MNQSAAAWLFLQIKAASCIILALSWLSLSLKASGWHLCKVTCIQPASKQAGAAGQGGGKGLTHTALSLSKESMPGGAELGLVCLSPPPAGPPPSCPLALHPADCTPEERDLQSPPGCIAVTATELKLLETSWGQKRHRLGTRQLVYSL